MSLPERHMHSSAHERGLAAELEYEIRRELCREYPTQRARHRDVTACHLVETVLKVLTKHGWQRGDA